MNWGDGEGAAWVERATFDGGDGHRLLEAHLLDVDGDLYGELLAVLLGRHLRGQRADEDVGATRNRSAANRLETGEWVGDLPPSVPVRLSTIA